MRTLVVPDVHGNYDRLLALLVQEGIVDPLTDERINHDVEVVQLGDLGDFSSKGSPTGDRFCYTAAKKWFDVSLYGNHDKAVVSYAHEFKNFVQPSREVRELIEDLDPQHAYAAHGFLITHAGLHPGWLDEGSAEILAQEINYYGRRKRDPLIDAIGPIRGGKYDFGGVLWRDDDEKLANVPQVFGHSRGKDCRTYHGKGGTKSYCIDVGSAGNGRLGAMWLPEQRYVEVQVPQDQQALPPGN